MKTQTPQPHNFESSTTTYTCFIFFKKYAQEDDSFSSGTLTIKIHDNHFVDFICFYSVLEQEVLRHEELISVPA